MSTSYLRTAILLSARLNASCTKVINNSSSITSIYKKTLLIPSTSTINLRTRSMASEKIDLTYNDITELRKKEEILLIDVRNPDEVKEGSIPGSINIPLGELECALQLGDTEFEMKYSFTKPQKETEMIFSCRSGNRSRRALTLAHNLGFNKSRHYVGGWLDWVEQTK